jgi:hypothetical protein
MNDLQAQALKLILALDTLLEPLEDTDRCTNPGYAQKLRKVLTHASIRYYRRREISKPTPYSLVAMIMAKAAEMPEPVQIPVLVFEDEEAIRPVQWILPKIDPKVASNVLFFDGGRRS